MDLDGTLIRTDSLWEALVRVARTSPRALFGLLVLLRHGKAAFKKAALTLAAINVESLPYRPELLRFLKREKSFRRRLVLITGSDQAFADRVNEHLHLFDEVIGSRPGVNLIAHNKRDELVKRYGKKGFVYIGDSAHDVPVWEEAAAGIAIGCSRYRINRLRSKGLRLTGRKDKSSKLLSLLRALRCHHWVKNVLVFLPIILAGQFANVRDWVLALTAGAALSIVASGTYLLNDVFDLEADRRHPTKRFRPLAAGTMPIPVALALIPFLLLAGLGLAACVSLDCMMLSAGYVILTVLYSVRLKRIPILDVTFLAALYCFRVFLGGQATGIAISRWTMLFCIFTLLSLALLKRFTELRLAEATGSTDFGRGYRVDDASILGTFGITSGYLGALVFALYLMSPDVSLEYSRPDLLWMVCPLLVYWVSRIWLMAQRGVMHWDPVEFAARDKASYVVFGLVGVILLLAR